MKYFNLRGRLFKRSNSTCFHIKSKMLALELHRTGFPFAKKPKTLSIPKIFLEDKELAMAVLRGLFNTDGSIYRLYKKKIFKTTTSLFQLLCNSIRNESKTYHLSNKTNLKRC